MIHPIVASSFLLGIIQWVLAVQAGAACLWEDPALEKWSEDTSWPSETPRRNEAVYIPAGDV